MTSKLVKHLAFHLIGWLQILFYLITLESYNISHQLEKFLQRGCWTRPAQFRMEGQQWKKSLRWHRDGPLGDHCVVKMKQKWGVLRVSPCSSIALRMTSSIMAFKPFISKQEHSRLILKATLTGENGNRNQGKTEAFQRLWQETETSHPHVIPTCKGEGCSLKKRSISSSFSSS